MSCEEGLAAESATISDNFRKVTESNTPVLTGVVVGLIFLAAGTNALISIGVAGWVWLVLQYGSFGPPIVSWLLVMAGIYGTSVYYPPRSPTARIVSVAGAGILVSIVYAYLGAFGVGVSETLLNKIGSVCLVRIEVAIGLYAILDLGTDLRALAKTVLAVLFTVGVEIGIRAGMFGSAILGAYKNYAMCTLQNLTSQVGGVVAGVTSQVAGSIPSAVSSVASVPTIVY